jgi:hypothetical protein
MSLKVVSVLSKLKSYVYVSMKQVMMWNLLTNHHVTVPFEAKVVNSSPSRIEVNSSTNSQLKPSSCAHTIVLPSHRVHSY